MIPEYPALARLSVRLGVVGVMLWFGLNQLLEPTSFLGYVPAWAGQFGDATLFVRGNGLFETVFATLLLLGLFTRPAAALLTLHMLPILLSVGYNEIGARDFAITLAALSLALAGPDKWCLDRKLFGRAKRISSR